MEKNEFYSRQIKSLGSDCQNKIEQQNVLVIGLDELGIELCKCICLLGIKKLYIYDPQYVKFKNYTFFSVTKKYIHTEAYNYLKNLNPFVEIDIYHSNSVIDIIVQTKPTINIHNLNSPYELNYYCRNHNLKYICCFVSGFSGYLFNDWVSHTILDDNGEKKKINFIQLVLSKNKIKLQNKCEFNVNSFINYNNKVYEITEIDNNYLVLDQEIEFVKNISVVEEFKKINKCNFKNLNEIKSCYPSITLNCNTEKGMEIKKEFLAYFNNPVIISTDNEKNFIKAHKLPIISCIIGSLAAQEIVKLSGSLTPIQQEFIIDYSDMSLINDKYSVINKNHEDVYSLFSKSFLRKLKKLNIFLVGCGALGCEFLKYFSMLDLSTGHGCKLTITDMDKIETSNLNRQFIFNEKDVGEFKSKVAEEKTKLMNPKIKVQSFIHEISKKTENKFNKNFWQKQDFIINAVDNINSRIYIDSQCIVYNKPMIDSGTLGCKSHIQLIIPGKTANYSDTTDQVEDQVPVCTIKLFPFKIEHCIEWSQEIFDKYFYQNLKYLQKFFEGKEKFTSFLKKNDINYIDIINEINNLLIFIENPTSLNFSNYLIELYKQIFIYPILTLQETYPIDMVDENSNLFWSGSRVYPILPTNNKLLNDFLKNFGKELSLCFGFDYNYQQTDYHDFKKKNDNKLIDIKNIYKKNIAYNFEIKPTKFYKNDNLFKVIEIISNIRAETYSVSTIDFNEYKLITSKITPALCTTTVLTSGLVIMELIKMIFNQVYDKKLKLTDFYMNSAINLYIQTAPMKPLKIINNTFNNLYGSFIKIPEIINKGYLTSWDKSFLPSHIKDIKNMITFLETKYSIQISQICIDTHIIYKKNAESIENWTGLTLINLYEKYNIPVMNYLNFKVTAYDNNIPVIIPDIYYCLSK